MLKRFDVTNYKNFEKQITVDFSKIGGYQFNQECITNSNIGKMLIYGRNATGKTNLGRAILDIANIGLGMIDSRNPSGIFLNADSEQRYAEFKYTFQFDNDEILYSYKRISESQLLDEKLEINGKTAFYYNFETKENQFDNLTFLDADTAITDRYLNSMENLELEENGMRRTLPFLRWLINNTALQSGSILLKLDDYIKGMGMIASGMSTGPRLRQFYESFYDMLSLDDNLQDFEDFLNMMGVECKLKLILLPDGQKELYFVHNKPVPFVGTASSGTISLMNLYKRLMFGKKASLLYIDEFDAFYHYEMSENVVRFFKKKYADCQIIMTTHNTNLMTNKLMRPDCLFILSGKGTLTALCDATPRELREGHNLEKLYISGEFERYE